jgi:hypothetical protein
MTKALDAALAAVEVMQPRPTMRKIHFEDHGQDFLWFIVDETGKVQDAGPFQGWLWAGKTGKVKRANDGRRYFVFPNPPVGNIASIKYPVTRTELVRGS